MNETQHARMVCEHADLDWPPVTIRQLYAEFCEQLPEDAIYYEAASAEQAGQIIMGPHLVMLIEERPISRAEVKRLRRLVHLYFGKVAKVTMPHTRTTMSTTGKLYRELLFIYEEEPISAEEESET